MRKMARKAVEAALDALDDNDVDGARLILKEALRSDDIHKTWLLRHKVRRQQEQAK